MKILTTNNGSYPRVGDKPGQQKLRQKYRQWEVDEISDEELEETYQEATREVIDEQVQAGLDIVTDGQLRWYDPISHFARKIKGCKINGLLRFFDTNFYFRQPVIKDKISWKEPIVKKEFTTAKEYSPVPVKPVVTGPYTMAKLSINEQYEEFSKLVRDFAKAISKEIDTLAKAGAEEIQVDEPAILKNPGEFKIFQEGVSKIIEEKNGARIALYTYFGDAAPLYGKLARLPIDILGLDFTYSPELPAKIARLGCEKGLGLGLIDGRNTKREDNQEILDTMRTILPNVGSERVYLNPSCGLDYLPRKVALEKLEHMVKIAEKAKEEFE
ncbi:hypothetical protein AKJ48_03475 [candidate division MSBL1 archaeon SCGC-AAA261O19]|uniref:Cobalamin-independent methionine synthase MetE C-terminal/archaeal domain-containing protein n=1 Tax=candidate division MSBL1 archaeon SCGC-AAA261O19 TaxID=1698277 RepID=A0A133VC58_9EURY|nr:hypothetical protein AKJ48_03475 [candidate division MSBL1 archaeon SCGC-AAA261O19]